MKDRKALSVSYKSVPRLDLSLFDTELLRGNEVAVEVATSVLEGCIENPAVSIEGLINDLCTVSHLFEYSYSVMGENAVNIVETWIMDNFPTTAEAFLPSIASQLLNRVSLSLLFVSYTSSADEPASLRDHRRSVELALPIITSLVGCSFPGDGLDVDESAIPDDDLFRIKSSKSSQRNKKKQFSKRAKPSPNVDSGAYKNFGVQVPQTKEDADELICEILTKQKSILQYYLEILRYAHLKETFRNAYVPDLSTAPNEISGGSGPDTTQFASLESVHEDVPAAYPMVQPMKAALYFDSADGFGGWRVLISTRADRDLRQAKKKNSALFNIIIKKIKELSNGQFSNDNYKQLTGNETDIPIYEAKMTRDSRLVYQIDCVPEFETDVEHQVIKLFGIYTHAQLDSRFWDGVGYQLGRKGGEYKRRCTYRNRPSKVGKNANIILPAEFPPPKELPVIAPSSGLPDLHQDDLEKLHEMLVLEKYVIFSQALLNSILADVDVAHVFDVSPLEKRIIEHPHSCYVLGRSGTGKTTTMLFKMLGIERSWQAYQGVLPNKPRQIFVTQSRVLAEKVKEFFMKLLDSLGSADKSPDEIRRIVATRQSQQEQGLVDLDEEVDWQGDLPDSFGQLEDEHFPMFITFDQLCRLLEAELGKDIPSSVPGNGVQLHPQNPNEDGDPQVISNDYMQQDHAAFISYGIFLDFYWPRFPQALTKGLDPALVFGEFMGVIKGSEQTLGSPNCYLDRETYFGLSHRTQGMFANQRDAIYKLYQAFLKLKRQRGEYDAADRTHAILKRLREGVPGKLLDFVYIDEAQDNLLIDALVLRTLCNNPDTGLFWAGDTAQTISIGSAFRFNDLKAFLYRIEESSKSYNSSRLPPQSFQLATNYRSHAGIVNCAHSVIELITQFWPHAIDSLAPERGIIEGIKPVFFTGWDEDNVRYEQFLFGESGSHIEFGAHQCILVRDDSARERLRAQVGDIGLIMTLYESKGLEFNDVLLYNFFADSTVDLSQWRVVLNALPEEQRSAYKAPVFDDLRHNGLCRDLKFLYVAITRARKNLWVADSSTKGTPMRILWTAKDQIQNCIPGSDVPRLAMSSTVDEWAKTALTLFNNKRYSQAMHCYERASLPRERAVAQAYYLREQARSTPVIVRGNGMNREAAFGVAAEAFWTSAEAAVKEREKLAYFRIAAECYSLNCNDDKAAQAYVRALEYTRAAQHYRKAGMFDEAVDVIKSNRVAIDPMVADSIIDISRLEYLRGHKLKQARELFETDEDVLEYMDDCGLDIARANFLEGLERFSEAAELYLAEGRIVDAIQMLLKDNYNSTSLQQASQYLLNGLWRGLSLGVGPNSELAKSNTTLVELLRLSTVLEVDHVHDSIRDELLMFRAIASDDTASLLQLSERFYQKYNKPAAALRCLDHVFSRLPKIQNSPASEVAICLQNFLLYVRLLQGYASESNCCDNEDVRRLLGFELVTEDFFLIPKETMLHAHCDERMTPSFLQADQGIQVLRWDLEKLLRQNLRARLHQKVIEENGLCHNLRVLRPCLAFCVLGDCNRTKSSHCPQDHIDMKTYNADAYTLLVRIHLQQILIYHAVYRIEDRIEEAHQRRYWLRRLHEVLNPPSYNMGSPASLRRHMIPELADAMHTVQSWIIDWIYHLNPYGPTGYVPTFLTSLIRVASLAFAFHPEVAHNQIPRTRCVWAYRPEILMRGRPGDQTYIVNDLLGFMENCRETSLSRGILFINHVLDKRVPIDVGVLCNFLDFLCGLLILCNRFHETSTLHDIVLPRSWILRLAGSLHRLGNRDTHLIHLYVRPMANLLEQMYTGINADYLLYESRNLSTIGYQIRNIFIARVCKNLSLLGCHCRPSELRLQIGRTVTSLGKHIRKPDATFGHYVTARSWDDLAWAVRQHPTTETSMDEIIHIRTASRTSRLMSTFPDVRRIVYNTIDEIPDLLTSEVPSLPRTAPTNGTASSLPVREPDVIAGHIEPAGPSSLDHQIGDELLQTTEGDEDAEADNKPKGLDEEVTLSIEEGQMNTAPVPSGEKELEAATVVLKAYRRYVLQRAQGDRATKAIHAIRHRVVISFHQAAQNMEWPCRYYQLLFKGPIPYLVVALEGLQDDLHKSKTQIKKRLSDAKHQELENMRARMTDVNQQLKEVKRLHTALQPTSDLHVRRDVEELKSHVLAVEHLASRYRLPSGTQEDLELAHKGIVTPKRLSEKQPKPELNVDDDYDYDI